MNTMDFRTLEDYVGHTPLVRLKRINAGRNNVILAKLEGNNPAGSVKDRPALSMVMRAEARGDIKPGDTLIEATSGNTGIALAMAAAMRGYRMILVMPEVGVSTSSAPNARMVWRLSTLWFSGGMEMARDIAERMRDEGKGIILDQFANPDNPLAHYEGTGPEIWEQTAGTVTHFVSSMGTTGTIMGTSRFLKEKNPAVCIIGCEPEEGSQIPGIRKWPEAYLPRIFERPRVDRVERVSQAEAEEMTRRLAREEGIFAGISSGGVAACRAARSSAGRERGDRLDCLRPWRPLPVDGCLPRLSSRCAARSAGAGCSFCSCCRQLCCGHLRPRLPSTAWRCAWATSPARCWPCSG